MFVDIALYTLLGFLSGSVLYSRVYTRIAGLGDVSINSRDHDAGCINAWKNGGTLCGICTFAGDFLKAFIPVYFFIHNCWASSFSIGLAFVMAAPVLGNCYSLFYHFKGTKSCAAVFGSLAALLPVWQPLAVLCIFYLLFTSVLVIKPALYQEICIYTLFLIACLFLPGQIYMNYGAVLIGFIVCSRCILSPEQREDFSMEPAWKKEL